LSGERTRKSSEREVRIVGVEAVARGKYFVKFSKVVIVHNSGSSSSDHLLRTKRALHKEHFLSSAEA
jgi:hypothetical protein